MSKRKPAKGGAGAVELMAHFDELARHFMREHKHRGDTEVALTRQEFRTLDLLGDTGERPMGELARELGLAMSSLTAIADRLVEKGLLERIRPDRDRRVVLGRLTANGRRLSVRMRRDRLRAAQRMLGALPPGEQGGFLRMMRVIRNTLTHPDGGASS